jgi:LacI family transcriptional regulator
MSRRALLDATLRNAVFLVKQQELKDFDVPSTLKAAPLMTDVARAARVSLSTVDRVLNRRGGVKPRTAERVLKAALATGLIGEGEHARLSRVGLPNIAFLLPMGTNPYLRLLGAKVRMMADSRPRPAAALRCLFIESFNAGALAMAIRRQARWAGGIAFMAIEHPLVREAVEEVSAAGTRLVTIVSDLPNSGREAYVGLDNQAAGRTAAFLLGRFRRAAAGSVALVAGSRTYRAHAEREMGFLGLIEEAHPELKLVGMREGHDDRSENYRHAMALLEEHADLVGIYNVGGSSDGIARALREKGKAGQVVFIGHGLTPDTRQFLIEGTMDAVINLDPDTVIHHALAQFARAPATSGDVKAPLPPLTMELIFRENIPSAVLDHPRKRRPIAA